MGGGGQARGRGVGQLHLRRVLRGVQEGHEAPPAREHVDRQGVHGPRQALADLRADAHGRDRVRGRHKVAERAHGDAQLPWRALLAHVPAHHQQPAYRHLQPRRALLWAAQEPVLAHDEDGNEQGERHALLDEGRVPQIRGRSSGQARQLLRIRDSLLGVACASGRCSPSRPKTSTSGNLSSP